MRIGVFYARTAINYPPFIQHLRGWLNVILYPVRRAARSCVQPSLPIAKKAVVRHNGSALIAFLKDITL
jgi:hypothetical protein